jgi:hypothetical protein
MFYLRINLSFQLVGQKIPDATGKWTINVDGSGRVNGRKVAHPRKEDGTINVDGGGRVKGRKVAHPRKEDDTINVDGKGEPFTQ